MLCAGLLLLCTTTAQAERSGTTTIKFLPEALASHGLAVEVDGAPAARALQFAVRGDSNLAVSTRDFEGWGAGELRHRGGFSIRAGAVAVALDDFVLRAAANDWERLELHDKSGRHWLDISFPQVRALAGRFEAANADLTVTPALAERFGRPGLAGVLLGVLELSLPDAAAGTSAAAPQGIGGPCSETPGDTDLELIVLTSPTQAAREAGVRIAMSYSATLLNAGTASIEWFQAIEPDSFPANIGPHPYLALHVYRIVGDVIEQIGRSDVKHAFFSTNQDCPCAGGHTIYPGCTDTYGSSTNLNRLYLAPREELSAFSGEWTRVGSHFDGDLVNDFRDHGGDSAHDSFEHRLIVAEPDLQVADAQYFIEAWYLVGGEINIFNSMGHRRVSPTLQGNSWSFALADGLELGSILERYVADVAGATATLVDTGEGRLQLAVTARDLGGGTWRYTYALMNFDVDGRVSAFTLPLEPDIAISNITFADVDDDGDNDWTVLADAGGISFQALSGNALDWGTLFVFAFDADRAPVQSTADLELLEPGTPSTLAVATRGPASGAAVSMRQVPSPRWAVLVLGVTVVSLVLVGLRKHPA